MTTLAVTAASISLFSPPGRRWSEGPDEGGEANRHALSLPYVHPLIVSHSLGTSLLWGEEESLPLPPSIHLQNFRSPACF